MTCSCSVGYTQSRITENQPELLSNLHKMRTLHNTIINPTYWNKVRSLHCGTAMPSIGGGKCYFPSMTDKSQPSIRQKDKNPSKRDTLHNPVSLDAILSLSKYTEYSKARLA